MNDQNKPKSRPEETPKNALGGTPAIKSSNGFKRLLSRKWVTPAMFMAAAAIIVTLMWIYQGADQSTPTTEKANPTEVSQGNDENAGTEEEAVGVISGNETMRWPVANKDELQVAIPYYDEKGTEAEKQAALTVSQDGSTYTPHTGVDFASKDNMPFDVMAALSGKVTLVEKHPTNGNVVEITHSDGLVTMYQSLSNVTVKQGDEVKQDTVLGQAGRSDLEKDLGIHAHFEVRKDGKAINPASLIQEEQ
ncbi:peptidoglycan DD-metalloendopeptidase family protein [Paenibacillus sp. GCM10023252]|uniref:peptidoglycan DD-metalloendopeptidase family protein n=1 Tax=Paenibacillus sp. GCM10023252 TaxID=3252649 RepID=UPI00361894AB